VAAILLDLDDYLITDTGDVIVRYKTLLSRLRQGESVAGLYTLPHEDVSRFNQRNPTLDPIRVIEPDGVLGSIPERCYEWDLPMDNRVFDLDLYLAQALVRLDPENIEVYMERLQEELVMMRERGMEDFIRLLVHIASTFRLYNVVQGIGRGSACASLVLYLIGVHMVDPILYDIPIGEFLR
jgi:Bacterial DNA polymerase III alpha NTPase domain